ncbi:MAG: SPOR domain-containing protein [Betaproteobacteria bacterium]|nr:SPOR domain-containing protein [Betaproteobacteria bacterium]MCC7217670.1 SPOR domain-containing protein [Burkholderiales bacterium]
MPATTSRRETSRSAPAVPRQRPSRRRGAGGTLLGVFIGLVLGLGLASGVAYYLMKANGPFAVQGGTREAAREPAKVAKADRGEAPDKPRFDFYKILPGIEEPKVAADAKKAPDRAVVDQAKERAQEKAPEKAGDKAGTKAPDKAAAAEPVAAAKLPERFWLQAGSFASEADAENLKARLALAGWQASVQQGTLPDKGVRYRVRLGPFDNTDELTRMRTDLAKNGFDVAVIKF